MNKELNYDCSFSKDEENKRISWSFWARNKVDFFWAVDECCDPEICEYKKLPQGSFMFPYKTSLKVPMLSYEDDDEDEKYREEYWKKFRKEIDVSEYTSDDMSSTKGWAEMEFDMLKVYGGQGMIK